MTRVPFLQQRRGFSLAELIIYLGILGISAGIFGGMLNTISTTQIAEFNQNEVSGQLNFAIQTIQRYVRAASIIEGESGTPSSTLVLQMPVAAQNPTSISLQNNRIYITQGATGTPLAITNDKVSIDNLEFRRFAQPASKDVVQIDIAISQESAGGKRIARSLRSAITRVNAAAFDSDLIPNSDGSYNVGTYPSARWRDGSFSGQVSAGSFCFASDCRTSWANIAGVSGSGSANYVAKWNTASTINASTLIYDNGTNVGIGAINPGYKLDVQGGQINTSGGLCINGDCKTAWSQIAGTQAWTATGTSIYYNTGNVGIGMVNPGSKLDVLGDIRSGTSYRTSIQGDGSGARVLFGSEGDPDYLGIVGAFASMMQIDSYNGPLVFKEAGSEKVRITSGNVGIGTTAPGAKLHVSGGSILMDNNLAFKFKDSTGTAQNVFFAGTDNVLYIQPLNVTKGTSIQYGNLGVGTNVPTAKLQVNPGTAVEGIRIISSDYSPFIIRNSADTADLFRVDQNGNITGGTGNASAWTRNSTSGYLYTSTLTDKVGIGTATPGTYNGVVSGLEVKGSSHTGIAINSPTDYAASLTLAENNNPMWHILSRGDAANRLEIYAADGTSSGAKITVLQGGNVGMGTTSPANKLTVQDDVNLQLRLISGSEIGIVGVNTTGSLDMWAHGDNATDILRFITGSGSGSERVRITNLGNVGIGTTSPAQKLSVAGTIESTSGGVKFPDGTTQTTAYAGGTQTIVSGNVSSGAFGSNTGGGNYSFPGSVGIGTAAPTAGYELDVVGNIMGSSYANIGGYVIGNGNYAMYRSNVSRGSITFDTLTAGGSYPVKLASGDGVTYTGGYLTYATDGAERMRIDSTGNVGIGTTNPIYGKLQITDSGTYADGLTLYAGSGNLAASYLKSDGASDFNWHLTRGGSDTIGMIIKANGNVGIGTTTPAQKLSVAGTIESTSGGVKFPDGTTQTTAYAGGTQTVVAGNVSSGAFGANTGGGNYSFPGNVGIGTTSPTNPQSWGRLLQVSNTGTNGAAISVNDATANGEWNIASYGSNLRFANGANSPALLIQQNGNVGIGTTGPTKKLEIQAGTPTNSANDFALKLKGTYAGNSWTGILFGATHSDSNYNKGGIIFKATDSSNLRGQLQFLANNVADGATGVTVDTDAKMVVDYSGNIGIGTTSPRGKLDVAWSGTDTGNIYFGDYTNGWAFGENVDASMRIYKTSNGTTLSPFLTILNGGNVGIGTTTPAQKLSVAGTIESTSGGVKFPDGTTQTTAYAGGTQTVVAGNVSSGAFGANTGGGNYSFPGNMGVGVASPSYKLEIGALSGSVEPTSLKINGGATNVTQIRIGDNYTAAVGTRYSGAETYLSSNSYQNTLGADSWAKTATTYGSTMLSLGISSTLTSPALQVKYSPASTANGSIASFFPNDLFTILGNGSVGIGTTSPGGKLTVDGSGETLIKLQSGGTEFGEIGTYSSGLIIGTNTAVPLTLETSNTARVTVLSGGNVGIGTTSPSIGLHVEKNNGNGWAALFRSSSSNAGLLIGSPSVSYITLAGIDNTLGIYKDIALNPSGGNVGIGTTTPATALHVVGTVTASAFSGALSGTVTAPNVSSGAFGANTGGGNYSFPGNVGIGTTGPNYNLEIAGSSATYGGTGFYTAGENNYLLSNSYYSGGWQRETIGNSAFRLFHQQVTDKVIMSVVGSGANPITWNDAFVIDTNTGNVGIGTTGPDNKLEVYTSATGASYPLQIRNAHGGTNDSSVLVLNNTSAAGTVRGAYIGAIRTDVLAGANDLFFSTSNDGNPPTEKVRITNQGNVGIGTTAPSGKLTILQSGDTETDGIRFERVGTNRASISLDAISDTLQFARAGTVALAIDNTGGNVGIGTTGPTHKLDVSGSFYSRLVTKGNCTGAVTIDWNAGNTQHCVLTGNVTFTFSNGQSGGNYKLVLKQGGTGSYTITWPGTVRWGGAVSPTLTTTVGKSDYVGFFYNGVDSTYDGNAFNANF